MNRSATLLALAVTCALLASGCAKKNDTPLESAVDSTKDALDVRDNEALKDAGEDLSDAAKNVGEAAKDVAADVKDAAKDAAPDSTTGG